ncbi:MAG TPA: RNA 2',3'-cyclic phosphodiesterase [Caulobacteraceae bacterium]|jgi:2'-5' RNA ligase
MIRLFAAIAIPGDIAEGLARRQKGLLGARWRPLENLHVTLRFFGPVSEDRADDLDAELGRIRASAFDLTLAGVGFFADGSEARAVWAGLAESAPLTRLAGRCETAARRAGLAPDRRAFRPHVTLAYLSGVEPSQVAAWVQSHNLLKSPPFPARAFGLYSSWRTDDGQTYRLERSYSLA